MSTMDADPATAAVAPPLDDDHTSIPDTPPPEPTVHALFDFADSDVTLLSSDGTHFRVHTANLAAVSMKFRDMVSSATPSDDVVPLGESAATLALLLAMCYPAEDPPVDFSTLEAATVLDCYEAAVKYQMWVAGLALRSFVE